MTALASLPKLEKCAPDSTTDVTSDVTTGTADGDEGSPAVATDGKVADRQDGEVYGGSVQGLDYGIPKGKGLGFVAFDLMVDGEYLDWDDFKAKCDSFGVETVPVLYRGSFNMAKVKEIADGNTVTAGNHIREGTVVKPIKERVDPKIGRVVLKYIGTEYALSKHQDKDNKDV